MMPTVSAIRYLSTIDARRNVADPEVMEIPGQEQSAEVMLNIVTA